MLRDEYNAFYRENPHKWESVGHDQFVYKTVAPYGPAVRLLDVGCGNGHTLEYFSSQWPGVKCFGVDLSDVAIGIARERMPEATFICEHWEDTTLNDFDVVLIVGVAEHFTEPLKGLERLQDALAKDGVAYVEVPNCLGYPNTQQVEGYRRLEHGSRQMEWHLRRNSWEKLIDDAGLNIRQRITGPNTAHEFVWIMER